MVSSTSSTSAVSSIVTTLGGGSGINMAELATNLAAAQFAGRSDRLTTKSDTLDKQISAAGNLKSMLLSLSSSLGDRVRQGDLSPQPKVASASIASAALSGTATPSGTYSLEVTTLAKGQALASPAFAASTTPVGSGSLTLRFGTVSGAGFSEDTAHAAVDITIASGATLADVASAINAKGAGVTAYVANTTTGAKLMLKGSDGATNGFVLEATETPGEEGLAQLAWNPATGDAARLLAGAGDAAFKLDGLPMSAKSNNITDAIPGLNLTLTATNPGAPTAITFADPKAAITTAMGDLTAALNEVAAQLAKDTDPQGGDLARDAGARALKRSMSQLAGSVIMPGAADGAPKTLADLGLSTQRDGTFVLDGKRLAATLKASPDAAAAMFTNGLYGVYSTIDAISRSASAASNPNSLGGSLSRYAAQKTQTAKDLSALTEAQDKLRAQLVSRFAATDTRVGQSKSTLSFLQNQIAAWNAKTN